MYVLKFILGTKAWGNKTKEMYYSLLSLKLKMTFFVLYHQSLQPNMNFNISKLIYSPPYLVYNMLQRKYSLT